MKNWLVSIIGSLLLVVGVAQAQDFEEGVHYEVIADEATSKPEITEFFSFYCVHCYRFEPIAKEMKSEYPNAFQKAHVSFISPRGNVGEEMTQAFVVAEKLGKSDELSAAIFDYNFNKNNMLTSKEDIRNVFIVNGVSGEEFDKAMKSFTVRTAAARMDRRATNLGVNATPTFIVNGKYKMLPQGFRDSDDFAGDFTDLAGYLLEK
jgi:thiol:disulfide interchange protein DsbA